MSHGRQTNIVFVMDSSHHALPFFLIALMASNGRQTIQGPRSVAPGLPLSRTTKGYPI